MSALDVAAVAQASRSLLQSGDIAGAESLLAPLVKGVKGADPSVLHLMGLVMQAQNRLGEAERYFRAAIADALSEGYYYNDLGAVLLARDQYAEAARVFRAAVALVPESQAARVNLVRCLMTSGEMKEAEAEARAFIALAPGAESWTLLMHVQRAMERHDEALVSAEQALRAAPRQRGARHNYAIALEQVGRAKEALAFYAALANEEIDTPELAANFARSLHMEGRSEEAEQVLEAALGLWPGSPMLHIALTRIRRLRGGIEDATAPIEAAVRAQPTDLQLRLVCADLLRRGGFLQRARVCLEEGLRLAPHSPVFLTSLGVVLDELDDPAAALPLLERAAQISQDAPSAKRNMIETLLRLSRAKEALAVTRALRQASPNDQHLLALETVALRMLGDPDYARLCDYETLVKTYEVAAPRGFFKIENFNASLAERLLLLHAAPAHPLDLNIQNGTQTPRNLLDAQDETIAALFTAIEAPLLQYIAALPAESYPARRRKRACRLTQAWSVRLHPGGVQPNHVHANSWISGTYYVTAPDTGEDRAGWLQFGAPRLATPGCVSERFVQPRAGLLVLFPSYLWHGVTPTPRGAERLTVSFDVVPA